MRTLLLAIAALALVGCTHTGGIAGSICYDGVFTSFCVVPVPAGSTIAPGTGMMPAAGQGLMGTGMLLTGEGAIVNGVAAITAVTRAP
jgi:hypothetical protein